jgi:hypothetical protein
MHRHQLVMKRGSRQTQQLTLTADRELRVVMIDQFSQLTGIRAVEILFQSLELHSELANQLEQLSLLGLAFVLGLRLLVPDNRSLAPSSSCFFYWLTCNGCTT